MATITPGTSWNGTAGVGWTGAGLTPPSDPTRTTFKPVCGCDLVPHCRWSAPFFVATGAICADGNGDWRGFTTPGGVTVQNGIKEVIYHLEGNSVTISSTMNSPRTNVEGYCVELSSATDGAADLYVEVVPWNEAAQSRVLGPYRVFFNQNGTLPNTGVEYWVNSAGANDNSGAGTQVSPWQTSIWQAVENIKTARGSNDLSGITLRCKGGTGYQLRASGTSTATNTGRFVVKAAPGETPVVTLGGNSSERLSVLEITVDGFTLDTLTDGRTSYIVGVTNPRSPSVYWLNCTKNTTVGSSNTSSTASEGCQRVVGNLVLNGHCDDLDSGDVLTGSQAAFNVTVFGGATGAHKDIDQVEGTANPTNRYRQNIVCMSAGFQCLFLISTGDGYLRDFAYVNLLFDLQNGSVLGSAWDERFDHVIFAGCTIRQGISAKADLANSVAGTSHVRGCVFTNLGLPEADRPGVEAVIGFRDNINGGSWLPGTGAVSNSSPFVNVTGDNLHLAIPSATTSPACRVDAAGTPRLSATSRGALEFEQVAGAAANGSGIVTSAERRIASGGATIAGAAVRVVSQAPFVVTGGAVSSGAAKVTDLPTGYVIQPVVRFRVNLWSIQNTVTIGPKTNERTTGVPVLLDLQNQTTISFPGVGSGFRHGDEFILQGDDALRTVSNHTSGVEGDYTSTPLMIVKRF